MKHASFRAAVTTALSLAVLGAVILLLLPKYWVFLLTAVFIVCIALQSLGLVTGRTGMISLCQMSFAGVGAWVTGYLNLIEAPGGLAVWMLVGGLAATALVRVTFDGKGNADEAERFDMGARIRDVAVGPDGAVYVIEDNAPGRLLRLTPR